MENQPYLPQVDFQIAINSFHDELINKLEQFNIIEIELLRKFECSINIPQAHSQLIFYLRNMIQLIQQTFKDVESYFTDLKINFLYDYFRKVQILMVNGFNFLSQALVIQIDQNEKDREYKTKQKQKEKMIIKSKINTMKDKAKDLEHCDYAINFYQNQEAKITQELHRMQQNIMMSKGLVDKLHPSKAVKQLLQIKQRAEITLQNTQKIFQETYQLKYLQFKQHLSKLKRPEDVTKQFCENIKITMKDKFQVGMKKSVNVLYHMKREDELRRHIDSQIQTDDIQIVSTVKNQRKNIFVSKNIQKIQNLLIKERKLTERLQLQLQIVRKDVQVYHAEKQRLKILCKQLQVKYKEYHSNYDILSKMYDQKREEVNNLKISVGDYDTLIDRLRIYERKYLKQFPTIDSSSQTEGLIKYSQTEVQVNLEDNQYIHILKKTNEKIIQKIREKQIRLKEIEKKQINDRQDKMSRFRISQAISSEVVANVAKQRQPSRSSLSSEKSITGINIKKEQKIERKSIKPFNPSRFSIKRLSSKDTIISKQKPTTLDQSIQVDLANERNVICTCKSIQVQFNADKIQQQERQDKFIRYTKKKSKPQFKSRQQALQILTQRKPQKNSPQRQENIIQRYPFRDQQGFPRMSREEYQKINSNQIFKQSEQKEYNFLFQHLNIETEENRYSMQKRNALSKNFIHNIKRKQRVIEQLDDKNKTCIGQFYKQKKSYERTESKHLICIDKLDITKKNKYKKTNKAKKSQILKGRIEKENMNDNTIQ